MPSPRVSIIIPVYNRGGYLDACLRSIAEQTCDDYEVVLADDGSTDGALDVARHAADAQPERIRLLRHPDGGNHGISPTRNMAIRAARGEFIAFIDTDDAWHPRKLEKQLAVFDRHPEAAICYTKAAFMDADGNAILHDRWAESGHGGIDRPADIFLDLIRENRLYGPTVMIRRERFLEAGMYPEQPRHTFEDWVVYGRIAYFHPVVFLPEALARFRFHAGSYTTERSGDARITIDAEKHYLLHLYAFLRDKGCAGEAKYREGLAVSLRRFLTRARAYHLPLADIRTAARDLRDAFPSHRGVIRRTMLLVSLTPPGIATAVRRARRRLIRL
jgi:glycosyltransferase involved in cell wall biosynthesis